MAKIVDKVQKRKDIALSCKKLFTQKRINDVTISEVAKTAGVGKGTVYDYFKNKEDIVFEIINILMQEHNEAKKAKMQKAATTKQKIKIFYDFFHSEQDSELRELYKEFISISLINPQEQMIAFNTQCINSYYVWFVEILQEGIEKGELKPEAIALARGMFVFGEGIFISSSITNTIDDLEKEIQEYLDVLFSLIEVQDD